MARIPDTDRSMMLNTVNQMSNRFTDYELMQIHEIALKLQEIYKSLIAHIEVKRSLISVQRSGSINLYAGGTGPFKITEEIDPDRFLPGS